MPNETKSASISKMAFWVGCAMSAPPVLLLLMSGVMKIIENADAVKGFAGWPQGVVVPIGIVEITCTVIYLVPRTSVLGAILLTGYLGGATATVVQMGAAGFVVMTVGLGVLLWGGLYMREPRVRALIPLKSRP
jgi:hypothetical protein